jgi:hypothetical protein
MGKNPRNRSADSTLIGSSPLLGHTKLASILADLLTTAKFRLASTAHVVAAVWHPVYAATPQFSGRALREPARHKRKME